ncbi:MAG: hypothetical protein AB1705_18495 [Verrucomicrobiota bacterium]
MKRRKKWSVVSALLALAGVLLWQFSPAQAVFAIASLSDPDKLATLGERGANPRLNKIVYWMEHANRRGMSPETTVNLAQWWNFTREPRASLVNESLARNHKIAGELGLFTPENLDRLRNGKAGEVTRGPYAGEPVEIDHLVPFSLAPEVGNELANLEMLPRTLNRKKSNRVNERALKHAERLFAAGLLKEESLARVKGTSTR